MTKTIIDIPSVNMIRITSRSTFTD